MKDFFYYLDRDLFSLIPRLCSRIYLEGQEHVPRKGPALLLCNHISHFDPPLITLKFPRVVHFMADAPLLKIPILGPMLRWGHAFPIDRSKNDRSALKTAMARLKEGHVVGIFPERGIRFGETSVLGGAELPLGTASLWKMMEVPVIPMIIIGSDQLYGLKYYLRSPRIFVRTGPLLNCAANATREDLRDQIVGAWKKLFDEVKQKYNIHSLELPHSAQERWLSK